MKENSLKANRQVTAVGAFIFDKEDRIFLAKFAKKFDKMWSIPGGKIDFSEEPIQAVKREIKEETNIDIDRFDFFTHGSFVVGNVHVIYLDYIAECPTTFEVKINHEFSEWGFFTLDQLKDLNIIPKTRQTVLEAFRLRSKDELVSTFSAYNLGLIRKTVCLQEHQANWKEAFTWIRDKLLYFLSYHPNYKIHHVGSTSIDGMIAKPVIDILLEFLDPSQFLEDIKNIEQFGFSYKGDAIGSLDPANQDARRHFFSFYNRQGNVDYVHLHALPSDHEHTKNLILFRERLNADSALRLEYQELKTTLKTHGNSRKNYTLEKASFVKKVLKKKARFESLLQLESSREEAVAGKV